MKVKYLFFCAIIGNFLVMAPDNEEITFSKPKFTQAGDKINCLFAKFLLEKTDHSINKFDCNTCVYGESSIGAEKDLKDALEATKLGPNIEIAKIFENTKQNIRNAVIKDAEKASKVLYRNFIKLLIAYSKKQLVNTSRKDDKALLDSIFKKNFENTYTSGDNNQPSNPSTNNDTLIKNVQTQLKVLEGNSQAKLTDLDEKLSGIVDLLLFFSLLLIIGIGLYIKRIVDEKFKTKNNMEVGGKTDHLYEKLMPEFENVISKLQTSFEKERRKWSEIEMKPVEKSLANIEEICEEIKVISETISESSFISGQNVLKLINEMFDIENFVRQFKKLRREVVQETTDKYKKEFIQENSINETFSKTTWKEKIKLKRDELFADLEKQITSREENINAQQNNPYQKEEILDETPALTYLYLYGPTKEGFFWRDKIHDTPENRSTYEMTLMKGNPERATFRFWKESKNINAAINKYDKFLEPVCELVAHSEGGREIQQIGDDGELYLDGNKWRVVPDKKLKIKIV
ncbi:hypothetical protein [Spongiimicrobium salis]|uniref:hypothetical protein n=1 Tax=Spongiimicrobium salis TaxID=1667022 RepID=UPI00374D686A